MSEPLAAALAAAREAGFPVDDPEVISGAANVFVHLRPAPVVARVTVLLDRGPAALEAELAFARAAVEHGAPVVPPAHDGVFGKVTFWQHVEHRRSDRGDGSAIGRSLRTLHEAVADLDVPLVRFDRLDEAERVASSQLMLDAITFARERLAEIELVERPIHGDAHARNVFITDEGPLWADLENVCRGPLEYDLACLEWRKRIHGWDGGDGALEAYGDHDAELVDALLPVLAAFLVPWNAKMAEGDDPYLRERIAYLKTFA
ncbi:MAG TPA: phosphotransferase [Gaiellaceae bacterium]|nr:phosphotransferase [Gaiellaceae bacterium]